MTYLKYAKDIITDKIIACKLVKLACQRFLNDLEKGKELGIYFDKKEADRVIDFYNFLPHIKGDFAGKPLFLEPWEQFIIANLFGWKRKDTGKRRFRSAFISVGRKNGKSSLIAGIGLYMLFADNEAGAEIYSAAALALDTEILTSKGYSTINNLKKGDKLFDEKGNLCNITYISPIYQNHRCYKIYFDNGEKIIADAGHLWETKIRKTYGLKDWKQNQRSIKNTEDLFKTQEGYLGTANKNHSIKICKSLKFSTKKLLIHPYILGVWLGDGTSTRGSIALHYKDIELIKNIEQRGYKTSEMQSDKNTLHFTILDIRKYLRKYNLISNKHIPKIYKIASIAQRLELLKGLMDTDGTCTKNGECRFSNTNKKLADDTYELLLNLGIKAHIRKIPAYLKDGYKRINSFIVSFKAYSNLSVFNLTRKKQRQIKKKQKTINDEIYIDKIEKIKSVLVKCIEVDSKSSLFLCGKTLISTHNTTRDQAKIVFDIAKHMVQRSKLKKYITHFKTNLNIEHTASKFEPLSADYNTLDGLSPHAALIDELHAHKTRDLYDVLITAIGARSQPLIISITTAGYDRHSICYEQELYTEKILEGIIKDDTHFGIIYTLDKPEEWEDEKNWIKANPNLGISVDLEDLRSKAKKAKEVPTQLNAFLRKNMNIWTESHTRWISTEKWDACGGPVDIEKLKGRLCYGGLDLSTTTDISALVLIFPPLEDNEKYKILCRFWIPQENMVERVRKDKVPYDVWTRQGYIKATAGNIIDYSFILEQIKQDTKDYDFKELAFDRWGSQKIITDLQNLGFEDESVKHGQRHLIDFGQGFASMNSPTKELEKMILSQEIAHGDNPVLKWMMSNIAIKMDAAGNIKPDKVESTDRIDGVVALIMAIDRATRNNTGQSVYEEREILVI